MTNKYCHYIGEYVYIKYFIYIIFIILIIQESV